MRNFQNMQFPVSIFQCQGLQQKLLLDLLMGQFQRTGRGKGKKSGETEKKEQSTGKGMGTGKRK